MDTLYRRFGCGFLLTGAWAVKLGEGVEWGLHCMGVLGALPPGMTLPAKALAEFHGVSPSYLLKHLKALVAAGLLESLAGPRGGYRLARPAREITFLDVVQAIEGNAPAFQCTEIRRRAPVCAPAGCFRSACAINVTMQRAEAAWREALRARTVADLVGDLGATLPEARQREAAAWFTRHVRMPQV
jgi:Rrf2 family protein